MCWWIIEAWNEIPAEMIVTSFKKCGITNTLDNSDNSLVRVEGGEEEGDEEHIVVVTLEQKRSNCEIKIDFYTYVINLGGVTSCS